MENIIKKGIIVYNTYKLYKFDKLSIEDLKKKPKERMVEFSDVISVSTMNVENWIKLKTFKGDFYEDRSVIDFVRIARESGYIFQKVTRTIALNLSLVLFKSNMSILEMINGDKYVVSKTFRKRLALALQEVWEK